MPWKEPGDKPREPKDREPWGHGGGHGGPDLEAWLRKLRRGLGPFGRGPLGALALIVLLIVLWFAIGGWVMVGDRQVGMVLQFGRLESVLQPGLHFRFPSPIDRVQIVDKGQTHTLNDQVRLLTSDGQLALVDYYVQFKITNARKFLFSVRNAEDSVRNAATVAVRATVGVHTLKQLMQRNDDAFTADVQRQLLAALARADIGITVAGVDIQNVGVPSQVKQAFDGIAKAREDAKAAQATAKANVARDKVETRTQAAALNAEADAYRGGVVADAKAEVARFDQILIQYKAAPQVTRHRLWLETMHEVLSKNRVVVNTGTGSVIVQFPARREPAGSSAPAPAGSSAPASASASPASSASVKMPVTSGPGLQGVGP
ncbi:MAG: FtsH protease activity modulator HflK [Rhodanobacteraceae bacterium]